MKNKIQIFAYKYEGKFYPEHIIHNLDSEFSRLEYGDVYEGEYQIWEYPSGKMFQIESDRIVKDNNYWSSPNADLWIPILKQIKVDKKIVNEALTLLKNKK